MAALLKRRGSIRRSLIASSISSLCTHKFTNPNPRFPKHAAFSIKSDGGNGSGSDLPPPPPSTERKSLPVATGELFLGLASILIRSTTREPEILMNERKVYMKEERGEVIEEVIWEQSKKEVEAEEGRTKVTSPGFSFSAAGLLFPYHVGVAQLLIEKGYIKDTTPLAGSSAGAIVCAVIASGNSMQEALCITKSIAEDCRLNGTAFRLGAILRDVLNKFLPDDIHIRCNGRVRVAITQLLWRPKGLLVDQFDSKADLINALFTSAFIPGYLAPRPATTFRNRLCADGALTLFMPPTSASKTICVCAFPANGIGLNGNAISPDCNPTNRATPRELFNWALEPASDQILDNLYEFGYSDAAVWADQNPVETV